MRTIVAMRKLKSLLWDSGKLRCMAILPVKDYPSALSLYLETVCNMDCFFCLYKYRNDKPQSFDIKILDKLDKAISRAHHISITSWGEPLLSPSFELALKKIYALNSAPQLIAIVTNGALLSPHIAELLDGHLADLSISVNAACAETYNRDMKGDLDTTIRAVRSFMGAIDDEDKPKVNIHFVAHGWNMNEIPQMIDIAESLGISRVRVDQFQVNSLDYESLSLVHCKEEYNEQISVASALAKRKGIKFVARKFGKERKVAECLSTWIECHVWADGRITQCCYNGTWFLGNLYEKSFEKIWFSSDNKKFARQCLSCPKILPFDDKRVHIYPYLFEKMGKEL